MKKIVLCIVFLLFLNSLFAQEAASPPPEGTVRDWEAFPYSLGGGLEYGLHTREDLALGYSAAFDRYLYNPYTAIGIRGTMFNDFNTISVSEAELNLRLYLMDLGDGALFTQLGFGFSSYQEDERKENTYTMDFTAGYRFFFRGGLFRGFYLEPFVRTGYPFEWGFGLFVGHWLNF